LDKLVYSIDSVEFQGIATIVASIRSEFFRSGRNLSKLLGVQKFEFSQYDSVLSSTMTPEKSVIRGFELQLDAV
jgi:hypothetical protein